MTPEVKRGEAGLNFSFSAGLPVNDQENLM
jgi:hypothetical protein